MFLLDVVLRHAKVKLKETHAASLDLVKAFDSVSHASMHAAAKAAYPMSSWDILNPYIRIVLPSFSFSQGWRVPPYLRGEAGRSPLPVII